MIILGIDPGFSFTGFSVIKQEERKTYLMDYGYLSLPQQKHLSQRVGIFYSFFQEKIIRHKITDLALETPFLGKNAQNFLKLGYLRGILYLLADQHGLILHEFSPREVKQAVTGFGGAQKDQVARVIGQLFPQLKTPVKADVTDALAVTLCGLWRMKRSSFF
ncbi:MAG: crossover junction endodeoxyribonuclease RuvC [Candidatus Babeliales bacterium]